MWRRLYIVDTGSTLAALDHQLVHLVPLENNLFPAPLEVNGMLSATFHCQAERLDNCSEGRI